MSVKKQTYTWVWSRLGLWRPVLVYLHLKKARDYLKKIRSVHYLSFI